MADGPGLRISIYCSGCNHRCPGCHNPETWDINNGTPTDVEDILQEILDDKWSTGVTFSGGDPLYQVSGFTELAKLIKQHTHMDIILYTGFTMDEILANQKFTQILKYIDYVVDGPFVESMRDENLWYRGSSNQNIWHIVDGIPEKIDNFPMF